MVVVDAGTGIPVNHASQALPFEWFVELVLVRGVGVDVLACHDPKLLVEAIPLHGTDKPIVCFLLSVERQVAYVGTTGRWSADFADASAPCPSP